MGSMRVQEIFGDVTPLDVMRRAAEQRIARDAAGAVVMDSTSPFGQIMDGVQQLSVTLALGGAGQFVKQSVPQIADLTLRLGLNNLGLIGQSIDLLVNHQDIVRELMKDSPITLREMDRLETQPDALSQKEKRALE